MTATRPRLSGALPALARDDPAFDISDEADLGALLRAEDGHFWHRARNRFIRKKLEALGVSSRARVLELGCGAGCVSAELARAGYEVTGVDGHRALVDVAQRRAPRAQFFCCDLRQGVPDFENETFDVVCLFDVIEHLENPAELLISALGRVRPGGCVVGTVPALMALWSAIDEHAGHQTRYSERALRAVLAQVGGGQVVEVNPFFRSLVPLIWMQRRFVGRHGDSASSVKNLRIPPRPMNTGLLAVVTLEHALGRLLDHLPVPGASLWFAVRRNGS